MTTEPTTLSDGRHATADRVRGFVDAHFRWPGVRRLHRHAIGLDLLRAPVNVIVAGPAAVLHVTAVVVRLLRMPALAARLAAVPFGFQTAVERCLIHHLEHELLEPTSAADDSDLACAGAAVPPAPSPRGLIARYAETRRATADLTTALTVGLAGIVLFDRFTPGAVSAGQVLADSASHHQAVSTFVLGPTLGEWFYGVFPATAPPGTVALTVVTAALAMAVLSAFSGLITDPALARLGIHQWRLHRLLASCERHAEGDGKRRYRPWDPFVARLVDLFDALRSIGS